VRRTPHLPAVARAIEILRGFDSRRLHLRLSNPSSKPVDRNALSRPARLVRGEPRRHVPYCYRSRGGCAVNAARAPCSLVSDG